MRAGTVIFVPETALPIPPVCVTVRQGLIPTDRATAEVTSVLHTNSFYFFKKGFSRPLFR